MPNKNPACLATLSLTPGYFYSKQEKNKTKKTSEQFISSHPLIAYNWHLKIIATALTLRTLSFEAKNYYHNNKNQQNWFILLLDMILNLIFCLAYCHTKMTEVCVLTASKINILYFNSDYYSIFSVAITCLQYLNTCPLPFDIFTGAGLGCLKCQK